MFLVRQVSALSSFRSRGLILRIQRKYRDYLDGCIEYGLQPYVPAVKRLAGYDCCGLSLIESVTVMSCSFQSFCAGRIQTWWKVMYLSVLDCMCCTCMQI